MPQGCVSPGIGQHSADRIPNRVVASSCGNAGSSTTSSVWTSSLRSSARPVSESSSRSSTTGTQLGSEDATISEVRPSSDRRSTPATSRG